MERVTWKLTTPCVKQIANEDLLYDLGNSNRGSINLEGWDGVGDGTVALEGGDMRGSMADSC